MPSEQPSTSTSQTLTKSERYGMMAEVHFTIVRNKSGWYVTQYVGGSPRQTHGPFQAPLNEMEALAFLISNRRLNQ